MKRTSAKRTIKKEEKTDVCDMFWIKYVYTAAISQSYKCLLDARTHTSTIELCVLVIMYVYAGNC